MKRMKFWLSALVICLALAVMLPGEADAAEVVASGECGDNLTWTLTDDGTLTISGEGEMINWRFSSYAPWYAHRSSIKAAVIETGVTSIGDWAFHGCPALTSVEIGDSVTSLGDYAFHGCTALTSAVIPEGVTSIGSNAFEACYVLTSVVVGDSVTSIGRAAFYDCWALKSIEIPDSVTSIGEDAFTYCTALTSIEIPDNVTSIGGAAFFCCTALTSVVIGDSVTSIGSAAFYECSALKSIVIPDSVTSIGEEAFKYCEALTSVVYTGTAEQWAAISIGSYNESLTDAARYYAIDSGITGDLTWMLDINGTLTISGEGEMDDWSKKSYSPWYAHADSVTTVIIEEGVTSIGDWAFYDCRNLISVSIPSSVTDIGENIFFFCYGLTSITVDENNTAYTDVDGVLFNIDMTELLFYPVGSAQQSYEIPESVQTIGNNAFSGCDALTSVVIPDGVQNIGNNAFSSCHNLTSITLPEGIQFIDYNAFYRCISLTSVTIPGTLSGFGASMFGLCTGLTNVVLSNGVPFIGSRMFEGCTSLESVTIPASVESIEESAFSSCAALKTVYYGGTAEQWQAITVDEGNECLLNATVIIDSGECGEGLIWTLDINGTLTISGEGDALSRPWMNHFLDIKKVVVEDGVEIIGYRAFDSFRNMTSAVIGASVSSIAKDTFIHCESLVEIIVDEDNQVYSSVDGVLFNKKQTSLVWYPAGKSETEYTVPDGVEDVCYHAFHICENLTTVNLPDGMTIIRDEAFLDCTGLTSIVIPGSVTSIGNSVFAGCTALKKVYYRGTARRRGARSQSAKTVFPSEARSLSSPV